jgi:hypothetical protein
MNIETDKKDWVKCECRNDRKFHPRGIYDHRKTKKHLQWENENPLYCSTLGCHERVSNRNDLKCKQCILNKILSAGFLCFRTNGRIKKK